MELFRPEGFTGKCDSYLKTLIAKLVKQLDVIEAGYTDDTFRFDDEQKEVLATLIVEFAEDLYCDIGLWRSIECYNQQMFSTPLPLFTAKDEEITGMFDMRRIQYFISTIYYEFDPDITLSPKNQDLALLAESLSIFLTLNFKNAPKDSGLKKFLSQPNEFGWDFKRKLVWVGSYSYLFRYSCNNYIVEKNKGKYEIAIIDDFVCQENTYWSGLGVTDILAKALNLPDEIQTNVRSWYERYASYYQVISVTGNKILKIKNIINGQDYELLISMPNHPFKPGLIVFGGIVPYGKYWYWSGTQRSLGIIKDRKILDEMCEKLKQTVSNIVYRYDKELLGIAREAVQKHHSGFVKHFGDDLAVFRDGYSMAAALQGKDRKEYEKLPKKQLKALMQKHQLNGPFPKMNFPEDLLETDNGVAVFFNKDEGTEIMMGFDDVASGFAKQGAGLTRDEREVIHEFIISDAISPAFVYKLAGIHGVKSVQRTFLLPVDDNNLDYLLHKYKGHFFRNRYPGISIVS